MPKCRWSSVAERALPQANLEQKIRELQAAAAAAETAHSAKLAALRQQLVSVTGTAADAVPPFALG